MGDSYRPLVSVIIPVYNTENYLASCIESLLSQTLDDIEFIFVDDLSSDSSGQILREYEKQYPDKIRAYRLTKKGFQGGARNFGLQKAFGDYVAFCDSDDLVHPRLYETLYKKIEASNADLACAQYSKVDEFASIQDIFSETDHPVSFQWHPELIKLNYKELDDSGMSSLIAFDKGPIWVWLCKKNIIQKNDIFFPECLYEDNFFSSLYSAYTKKVVFIEEVLYFYRDRQSSTVNSRNMDYQLRDRIYVENRLQEEVKKRGLYEKYYDAWEYIYTYRYVVNTISKVFETFDKIPYKELSRLGKSLKAKYPHWSRNKFWKMRTNIAGKCAGWLFINCPKAAYQFFCLKLVK